MSQLVGRQQDFLALNRLLGQPRGQLAIIYGRRGVGKTSFVRRWAEDSGLPYFYWSAPPENAESIQQSLTTALTNWVETQSRSTDAPRLDPSSRSHAWNPMQVAVLRVVASGPAILILDDFHRAAMTNPALPSYLQILWDLELQHRPVILILVGSQPGLAEELLNISAPLYGRPTFIYQLDPLPCTAVADLFPGYSAVECLAIYAALGGIPVYLEQFDPQQNLDANIRHHLFPPRGVFRDEVALLIDNLGKEPSRCEEILRAIARGCDSLSHIARVTGLAKPDLLESLYWLQQWQMVEHQLPVTSPPEQRLRMTALGRGRYYPRDPYLHFHFRFIEPCLLAERGQADAQWSRTQRQFWTFVGATAFQEQCRLWIWEQARAHKLPFQPERVGRYWGKGPRVDLMAINWRERAILLGECQWNAHMVGPAILRELVGKAPSVEPAKDWQVYYAVFARSGFSDAAREDANALGVHLVDLEELVIVGSP